LGRPAKIALNTAGGCLLYLTNTLSGVGEVYQTAFYGLPSDVAVVGVWRALSAGEVPPAVGCAVATATPALNIPQLINELATYGVLAYAQGSEPAQDSTGIKGISWTQPELEQILFGVQTTASAFLRIKAQLGQYQEPKSLFRKIMGDFKVVHVVNGFQHVDPNGQPVYDGCDNTQNAGCTSNDRGTILFFGNFYQSIGIIQYTMVHELGHRFDNRSNIPESNESISERLDSGEIVLDCGYPFIPTVTPGGPTLTSVPTLTPGGSTLTPTKSIGLVMGENLVIQPWTRGERGWGSGPARQPGGGYLITDFQQHPAFISSSVSKVNAIGEAAADMFLNWVYRGGSDYRFAPCLEDYPGMYLSFRNEDWRNMTSYSAISGTPDNTKPGAKRQSWFENIMGEIFVAQAW
jgi:hypothetical protein